jgi:tetratricopeptide (TPR) repeat protein
MRVKTVLAVFVFLVTGIISSYGQRDKKRSSDPALYSARLTEAEGFFIDGEKHYILEDYAKALAYFQRAAELNPDNPAVHYKIAEVLAKSDKEDDLLRAAASAETALRLEKKNSFYYLLSYSIYSSLNNFPKAEQTLESLMREVKGSDEYLYELAAVFQYDHKPEEAIKTYNKAEAIFGINEISSLQKLRLYLTLGNAAAAEEEGRKLIEMFPDEPRYVVGFAEILSQFKQGPKAIALLEDYLKTHPDAGSAKMLLAGLYRENGQEQKSRELTLAAIDDPTVDVGSKVLMVGTYNAILSQMDAKKSLLSHSLIRWKLLIPMTLTSIWSAVIST